MKTVFCITLALVFNSACSSQSVAPEPASTEKEEKVGPQITSDDSKSRRSITKTFTQIDRENKTETFKLNPASFYSETLIKASPAEVRGKIDILIVVDNSGSMAEEQKNLSTKVSPLLSEIEDQDWQINVITTDDPCPTTKALPLTQDSDNLIAEFEKSISVGTSGSGNEKAIEMAYNHIKGVEKEEECQGASWMRQDAGFSMIILSDEDEDKTSKVGPSKFVSSLAQFGYETGFNARVFGIVSEPKKPCQSAMQPAKVYTSLITRTAGITGDICASDYTEILELISVMLTDLVVSEMKLEHVPEPASVKVLLNGQPFAPEYWRLAGDVIVFAYSFVTGDTVQVDYLTEFQRSFPLSASAINPKVLVDNNNLAADRFKIIEENAEDGSSYLLYIPELGVESKTIKINYKEDLSLKKRFDFIDYDESPMSCTMEGVEVDYNFNPVDRTIGFDPTPEDGEVVECVFEPKTLSLAPRY